MWDSKEKILEYGRRLVGGSLAKIQGIRPFSELESESIIGGFSRSSFGLLLERFYYNIHPGSISAPDFTGAGVELKSTPVRFLKGSYRAKERLVLNKIDFKKEAAVSFEESSFLRKNASIMLVSYLHESGVRTIDLKVVLAELFEFYNLPDEDRKIIREDWEKIHAKIVANKAHELSEGDTFYLGACTKGATSKDRTRQNDGTEAKPRAYAFKSSYMTAITRRFLKEREETEAILKENELKTSKTFEEMVIDRFAPYVGKTVSEIHELIGEGVKAEASKGYLSTLARRIMGVKGKRITEFENADVQMKTIQITSSGMPKESMSFPAFVARDLAMEDWDIEPEANEIDDLKAPSTFKQQLQKRFFFVIFKCDKNCKREDDKILHKVMFWTIPTHDLEGTVRQMWSEAVDAIKRSEPEALPKLSDQKVIHVRPHGKNAEDKDVLPNDNTMTKRCFWLNAAYLKSEIDGYDQSKN